MTQLDHWNRTAVLAIAVAVGVMALMPCALHAAPPQLPAPVPMFASWQSIKSQAESLVFNTFRSRQRMIQMIAVGLAIGLFIMLKRMPGKV